MLLSPTDTHVLTASASEEFTAFAPPYPDADRHAPFPGRFPVRPRGLFVRTGRFASQANASPGVSDS